MKKCLNFSIFVTLFNYIPGLVWKTVLYRAVYAIRQNLNGYGVGKQMFSINKTKIEVRISFHVNIKPRRVALCWQVSCRSEL